MSAFFSRKYLRYRESLLGGEIEADLACRFCGYNVRGLRFGKSCPECGRPIEVTPGLTDLLTEGDMAQRDRWRLGLMLASGCLMAVVVLRSAFFLGAVGGGGASLTRMYVLACGGLSLAWIGATWLVTPISLQDRWPWARGVRRFARVAALAWLPGYALLAWKHFTPPSAMATGTGSGAALAMLEAGQFALRAVAGTGALVLSWLMMRVAREAELDDTARHLERPIIWLPIFTLLILAFVSVFGGRIPWILLIFLIALLVGWCWYVLLLAKGFYELAQHVVWTRRHAHEAGGRWTRIATTRRALEEQAEAIIRPVDARPRHDLPVEGEVGVGDDRRA